jgi:hypothetical protein
MDITQVYIELHEPTFEYMKIIYTTAQGYKVKIMISDNPFPNFCILDKRRESAASVGNADEKWYSSDGSS